MKQGIGVSLGEGWKLQTYAQRKGKVRGGSWWTEAERESEGECVCVCVCIAIRIS